MNEKVGWWITCPACEHRAHKDDFNPSLSDELTCPECRLFFQFDPDDDDYVDNDDDFDDIND